jgi:MoaA/NifB/PqqE/SkfB family radical SAM enzyme
MNHRDFYDWHKLTVCVTSCCDQKCLMCPAPLEDRNTLNRSAVTKLIRFAAGNGFKEFEFTGGEPLLLGGMLELINMACQTIPLVQLTTNGLRLNDDRIERLARYRNLFLLLPVDGIGETYDSIRQIRGGFERFDHILQKVLDAGIPVVLNTVVQSNNHHELYRIFKYFSSRPILFHGFPLIEHLNGNERERLNADQAEAMLLELGRIEDAAIREKRPVPVTRRLRQWYGKRLHDSGTIMHKGVKCPVPFRNLIVTAGGFAIPCWQYGWRREEGLRGLRVRNIESVVNDNRIQDEIRSAVGGSGCRGCSTFCYNWDPEVQHDIYGCHAETFREQLSGKATG